MISPKRIERLWAACPELRPDGMHAEPNGCFYVKQNEGEDIEDEYEREEKTWLYPTYAHALIRDRIVWWLAEQSFYLMPVAHCPGSNGNWCFQLVGSDSSKEASWCESGEDFGADPTLACLLAAERVLNLPEWTEPTTPDVGDFRT